MASPADMEAKPRLNMTHGFMKHIIKNQVDRDNYDKEVKAKFGPKPKNSGRHKKPDMPTYVPPRKHVQEDSLSKVLFKLEYEDQAGVIHEVFIHQDEDPAVLSRRFAQEHNLSIPMMRAFAEFLHEEINKRVDIHSCGSGSS